MPVALTFQRIEGLFNPLTLLAILSPERASTLPGSLRLWWVHRVWGERGITTRQYARQSHRLVFSFP